MTAPFDSTVPADAGLALRPLGLGELLDAAFAVYRRLFGPLVALQMLCGTPGLALIVYGDAAGGSLTIVARVGALVLNLAFGTIGAAATALVIGETYLGRSISIGEALRRVRPFFGAVLGTSLLVGAVTGAAALPSLLAFAGMTALVQTGSGAATLVSIGLALGGLAAMALPLWVFAGTALATVGLVLEKLTSGREALRRSWRLTAGARGRLMLVLLILTVILAAVLLGVSAAFGLVGTVSAQGTNPILSLLQGLAGFVLQPVLYCVLTLFYYDRRVRLEGFDLELLAGTLT